MIALLHLVTVLNAATITSTASGGTWTTKNTWVGRVVPTSTDIVVIATTGTSTVTLTNPATCAGITVNLGSILAPNANTLTVNGIVNNLGTINITTGGITQTGTSNFTNDGTINLTTGIITQSSTGSLTNNGIINFTGTGLLTFSGNFANTGTLTLGTSPVTFSGSNTASCTVDGFTTSGLVTYSRTAGSTTFTGNINGAGLTINGAGGNLNLGTSLNHTFTGAITITAGTLNGGSSTLNANFPGVAWSRTGTFNAGTGTINFGNAGDQSISGSSTIFNNLSFSGSGVKSLTAIPTVNGILSIEGSATLNVPPTFGAASTIQYKGTGSTRTISLEFPTTFSGTGGIIIDPGNGNTITLNESKTAFLGNLNVKSGILDLSTFTLNRTSMGGTLTLSAGTTLRIGGSNSLPSNYTTHSFDISSTVLYQGSGAQIVGGSATTQFGNLSIDNANGVSLNFNQAVNGTLTLSNGLLNTGSNTLTVGCSGSIANASAARYVNGKLAMTYCSTGSKVFPIGKGGNYRPLTLNYSALTGTSTVTAEQIESTLPGTIPSDIDLFSTRYWQLSQTGGSSYSFNLTLDGTDWSPTSYLKMLKGDGSTNAHHAVTTPNYTNSTAFTSFGNFGLGQLNCVTWLGTTNDWYTTSNWTSGTLPTSTDDIRIPSAVSFYPSIISGSDISIASTGKLQVLAGASVTLESGPVLTFQSGATVTTSVGSKIVLKSDAKYLNLSSSTPTLEVQRQLTGTKGWRMLASPVATTYSDMFKAPLVTQGFTGSGFPALQPNLLWWDETDLGTTLQSWRQPSTISENITSGRGYFHYIFDDAGRNNLDGSPSGSNYGDALPITMTSSGVENYDGTGSYNFALTYTTKPTTQTPSPTDTFYYDLNALDQGWNLIGNPTASTLDWDAISGWTKTNVESTIYIWDPSANSGNGDYLTWNGSTGTLIDGRIAPFQAFWVHAASLSPPPSLQFTNAVKTGTLGTFLRSSETDGTIALPLTLTLGEMQTTSYISFSKDGISGPDRKDAYQLQSMSENWLELYSLSSAEFVSPLVINHLPILNDEMITIPLYYDAQLKKSNTNQSYTLNWKLPDNWPSDWKISLQDHKAETSISMTENASYSFGGVSKNELSASANQLPLPQKLVQRLSNPTLLRSSSSVPPFNIVISKGKDIDYMAPTPKLLGSYPNPFKNTTTVRFSLSEKAKVSIEVYSAQGLKVAILANGQYAAGITELRWDAASILPGLYFIKFKSGETVETKKAILIN